MLLRVLFNLTIVRRERDYRPQFTEEQIEFQRGEVTCHTAGEWQRGVWGSSDHRLPPSTFAACGDRSCLWPAWITSLKLDSVYQGGLKG